MAARAFAQRADDLHRLDLVRSLEPDWFQRPGMVGYAAYTDRFADTLAGVAAVVMIFAVTLAGPRVHAGARTEVGRTVAVVLQSVGFGGVLGALLILT